MTLHSTDWPDAAQTQIGDSLGLRLVPLSQLARAEGWGSGVTLRREGAALYWITRGQGRLSWAGCTQGYGAHNALYLPAGAPHRIEAGTQIQGWALLFDHPPADPLWPQEGRHLRLRDVVRQGDLTRLLDDLHRELDHPEAPGHARACAHHLGLLSIWLARQPLAEDAAPCPMDQPETPRPTPIGQPRMAAKS